MKIKSTRPSQDLAHTYNFHHHTEICNGHLKLQATQGLAYKLNLANTVYCSCNAITVNPKIHIDLPPPKVILNLCGNITLGTRDHQDHSMAKIILDPTLIISQNKTFSNLEKKSILQSHKAVLCHYKIFHHLPDFHKRVYLPKIPTILVFFHKD